MFQTVTYCPEDNKLRLYVGRVPRSEYEDLRAAGFTSTPKQSCDFVATWTPEREDLARQYLDDGEDIGDEDYSPEERAADRAERFEGYRDKRMGEAGARADAFAAGPQVFGHQSRNRAERQARRHDRHRTHAVSQWSRAEYWQERTAGVIGHALYKSSAAVRRGRILTLEAEQRKQLKSLAEYAERFAAWQKVFTLEGAELPVVAAADGYYGINSKESSSAALLAYSLANSSGCWGDYTHPRTGERKSLYSLMVAADPITAREAAALWLAGKREPGDPESWSSRWAAHYELRLSYERAMLDEEGGTAAAVEIEPGGWIQISRRMSWRVRHSDNSSGWFQVQKVNKSPATGRVVSVAILAPTSCDYDRNGKAYGPDNPRPMSQHLYNIERQGEDAYRAPTDEERAAFAAGQKKAKAERKATAPKTPPLINPTLDDAERLQSIWNDRARQRHEKEYGTFSHSRKFEPKAVLSMTQERYSAISKGTYAKAETRTLHANALPSRAPSNMWSSEGSKYDAALGPALCKIRVYGYNPLQVVILTDKPQKALPMDAMMNAEPVAEVA